MNEQLSPDALRNALFLRRYIGALESGDVDTLVAVLAEAEQDPALEHMILEVDGCYQQEDQSQVQPADVAQVRQILLEATSQAAPRSQELKALPTAKVLTQVSPSRRIASRRWYQMPRTWLVAAVILVLFGLVVFPSGGALASQFLSLFRIQQLQPVQVSQQDIHTLSGRPIPSLEDLGSVKTQPGSLNLHDNLTEAQAAKMVNFPILLPHTLPQGIPNAPGFGVMDSGHANFTFHSSQARAFFAKNGYGNVAIPANLDGATFDITTSAAVQVSYGQAELQFMVAEARSPVLRATGTATLQDMRNFVLSLPGLPSQLVDQLRKIDLMGDELPLLIPSGVNAKPITVHGTTGLLFTTSVSTSIAPFKQLPIGSAAVWQAQGIIYALGGTVSNTSQLMTAANSLR